MSELIKNLPHSTTLTLADQLSVQEGQVTSLTLAQPPPETPSSSASRAAGKSPSRACSTCFFPGSPSS